MGNSPLVAYMRISPNCASPRRDAIRKITVHHMAGDLTVEACGAVFASPSRQASANYGIGSDGRVGMCVEEKDRAWTSDSPANDNQAVTVEVANCGGAPDWPVSDRALASLIDLCADICRRNGIGALNFTGDAAGNLTMHKYFAATVCPGPYLESKFPHIAGEVNRRLIASGENEEDDMIPRYKTVADMPEGYRARIQRLIDKGVIAGRGGDLGLDLSEDMVRLLIYNDRAGLYGD
jgi:hypothetical protein